MSDKTPTTSDASPASEAPQMNESMVANIMQMTLGRQYIPTSEQVDKLLALQEKGMDYTHKERTSYLPSQVLEFWAFFVIIAILALIFTLTILLAPQYLEQVASGIIGLIGGGLGGYGYGVKKSKGVESQ